MCDLQREIATLRGMVKLKADGRLRRVGGRKEGHWEG